MSFLPEDIFVFYTCRNMYLIESKSCSSQSRKETDVKRSTFNSSLLTLNEIEFWFLSPDSSIHVVAIASTFLSKVTNLLDSLLDESPSIVRILFFVQTVGVLLLAVLHLWNAAWLHRSRVLTAVLISNLAPALQDIRRSRSFLAFWRDYILEKFSSLSTYYLGGSGYRVIPESGYEVMSIESTGDSLQLNGAVMS